MFKNLVSNKSFFYLMVIIYNKISTIGYKINKLHVYTLQLTLTPTGGRGGGRPGGSKARKENRGKGKVAE